MVENIRIRNYKSIVDLTMDLGRFNVIIGTNGCGKSNILEAITMAAAASQDKLDAESLKNRGIRETEPQFMMNAFDDIDIEDYSAIQVDIKDVGDSNVESAIIKYSTKTEKWENLGDISSEPKLLKMFKKLKTLLDKNKPQDGAEIDADTLTTIIDQSITREVLVKALDFMERADDNKNIDKEEFDGIFGKSYTENPVYTNFVAYRPVEKILRDFNNYTTYPLGSRGEGLFQYLKKLAEKEESNNFFEEINDGLRMLDWFDGFNIPDDLLSNEYKLSIGDKFLKDSLHYFDQRSTNEGFLYLLFFLTLFNSKDTPQFFAVDNIETSFNPGLCQSLTKYLIKTTKEKEKQVILTTHNPFVLDGMDLSDDEVRLFVCRRDIDGHTKIERVKYREDRKMSLSELWMSGLIGALPDNF